MDWVLRRPDVLGLFSRLGYKHAEGYHISENCNDALQTILHNILVEDRSILPFRRSIGFGQNIEKDLIPLLLASKDDKTTELLIKILMNLTMPVECLLSSEFAQTYCGRHTMFELTNLLNSSKEKFTDHRVTKVVIDFLKKNADVEQSSKLSAIQVLNIANCLVLLRNVLHIPEAPATVAVKATTMTNPKLASAKTKAKAATQTFNFQNKIIWNIFSQRIDKILINLMTIPEADSWCVSIVQLIEVLFKDQKAATLQKLVTVWLESSLIESSDENESNTSPINSGSDESSPVITSEPTSDSSDTQDNDEPQGPTLEQPKPVNPRNATIDGSKRISTKKPPVNDTKKPSRSDGATAAKRMKPNVKAAVISVTQGSISTSSNDEQPEYKKVHYKPHNLKQKANSKIRLLSMRELMKLKLLKRTKITISTFHAMVNNNPSDNDISLVLKEFTVDFLLKGFNSLVQTLHSEILTNRKIQIETSHFFWLISYFLKFATHLELEIEQVNSVLTFEIVSYLTAESVNLCEQFELACKLGGQGIEVLVRRQHLLVSAIREIFQTIEAYSRQSEMALEDHHFLLALKERLSEMDELRSLFVLLLRHYNQKLQSKPYLQDLVIANYNLIVFLEDVMGTPKCKSYTSLKEHIQKFASKEVMQMYGLVLEDYSSNGQFVNDCVFTMMHHVVGGGDKDNIKALYQTNILKSFAAIWESDFKLYTDCTDLIEYTITNFVKKPQSLKMNTHYHFKKDTLKGKRRRSKICHLKNTNSNKAERDEKWSEEALSSLNWHYLQNRSSEDVVGEVVQLFNDDQVPKSRKVVLEALKENNIISDMLYEKCMLIEKDRISKQSRSKDEQGDQISKLCNSITREGLGEYLSWLQMVLLETCFAKIYHEKCRKLIESRVNLNENSRVNPKEYFNKNCNKNYEVNTNKSYNEYSIMNPNKTCNAKDNQDDEMFELFKKMEVDCNFPLVSPVAGHFLMMNESVPVVPWTTEQAAICKDLNFLQLMHQLGFELPIDTGKVFIRIPCVWSAEHLYELAGKLGPIDISKLKFSVKVQSAASPPSLFISASKTRSYLGPDELCKEHKLNRSSPEADVKPRPTSSLSLEEDVLQDWMDIIRRSQEHKMSISSKREFVDNYHKLEESTSEVGRAWPAAPLQPRDSDDEMSLCSAASEVSSLTRMYVSDEEY